MNKSKISIRIQNFRNIHDFTFEIKSISFLFGKNATGKTSLIKALLFLRRNIFPLRLNKTIYHINDSINLVSFNDIITNGDITKKIRYEIHIVFEGNEEVRENDLDDMFNNVFGKEYEYHLLHKDFSVRRREVIQNQKTRINKKNPYDFNINIEFAYDPYENNLNLFELRNNSTKETLRILKKKNPKDSSSPIEDISSNFNFRIKLNIPKTISSLFKEFLIKEFLFSFVHEISDGAQYLSDFWDSFQFDSNDKLKNSSELENEMIRSNQNFKERLISHLFDIQNKSVWKKFSVKEKKSIYLSILDAVNIFRWRIPLILRDHLQIHHIPTIREIPKYQYLLNKKVFKYEDYYGIPSFLEALINEIRNELNRQEKGIVTLEQILDEIEFEINTQSNINAEISQPFLNEMKSDIVQITEKLRYLGLAEFIFIEKTQNTGQLKLKDLNGVEFNVSEASSGLQQILPIIFATTDSFLRQFTEYNSTASPLIFIEQPELHLHPGLQIRLIETILSNTELKICLETHSEHIIRRVQVMIAQGKIKKDDVVVNFFDQKDKSTIVKQIEIEDNGFFKEPWPDEFFDDSFNLSMELLTAKKN